MIANAAVPPPGSEPVVIPTYSCGTPNRNPMFLVFDEDLNRRNRVDCNYLMALGPLGLEQPAQARERLETVLALDANHLGAHLHRGLLEPKAGAARADRFGG